MASSFNIDVDVPKVVMVGGVSVALLIVTLMVTHGYYLKYDQEEFARKYYDAPNPLLDLVKSGPNGNDGTDAHLGTYRWIDQATGTAQIPIDEAIKMMAQSKGKPPTTQPLGPAGAAQAGG